MYLWYSTLENTEGSMPIRKKYFNFMYEDIDLWTLFPCVEEFRWVHWCVMHNWSRATINELFRNPIMATVSKFTSFHIEFKGLNEMLFVIGFNYYKLFEVGHNAWLIQTTFVMMIKYSSATTIVVNALRSSCDSPCSGNLCHIHPLKNWMKLRNISTQRWHEATGGGMTSYISWILS